MVDAAAVKCIGTFPHQAADLVVVVGDAFFTLSSRSIYYLTVFYVSDSVFFGPGPMCFPHHPQNPIVQLKAHSFLHTHTHSDTSCYPPIPPLPHKIQYSLLYMLSVSPIYVLAPPSCCFSFNSRRETIIAYNKRASLINVPLPWRRKPSAQYRPAPQQSRRGTA